MQNWGAGSQSVFQHYIRFLMTSVFLHLIQKKISKKCFLLNNHFETRQFLCGLLKYIPLYSWVQCLNPLTDSPFKNRHISFYCVLLCFTDIAFYNLKVCGNITSSESTGSMLPTASALFLCHVSLILKIFQTFKVLLYLSWWSVISDLWYYYCDCLRLTRWLSCKKFCNAGDLGSAPGSGRPPGKRNGNSIFAWEIPGTEEPGRLANKWTWLSH